jgi:hypothetical protein
MLVFSLAFIALVIFSQAQEAAKRQNEKQRGQPPAKQQDDSPVRRFMHGKLDLSQNALEGIVTEDFDQILRSAQGLRVMSLNTMWYMYETPEYIEHSSDFLRIVTGLMETAEKKNLDGAAVRYVELTLNCVNCHKHVRSVGVDGRRPVAAKTQEQLPLDHDAETELFQFLVDNRQAIRREVTTLPNGVETVTESDVEQVRQNIVRHVESMHRRMKEGQVIRQRDPLFVELFKQANKITTRIERTDKGLKVRETSEDDYAVKVIQAHAEVVSLLLKNGRQELRKNHEVPPRQ